jgi:inhibitor of KinA sporulation pathway (predicted exonuclease)
LSPCPEQFERQCDETGAIYPFGKKHVNAKMVFTAARGLRRRPGMARAPEIAWLPLVGRHHSGTDDAWNIAALILDLHRSGHWPSG